MSHYTASAACGLEVSVGARGGTRVHIPPAAGSAGDEELANRIMRLNTLAVLRRQASMVTGTDRDQSEALIAAYAALIEF